MSAVTQRRKISVVMENVLMRTGSSQRVQARIEPPDAGKTEVKWFTSDRDIASVDEDGTVHAHARGRIALVAELADGSGNYGAAWLRVTDTQEEPEEYVITFDSENGSGETFQVTALEGLPMVIPGCPFAAPSGMRFCFWDMDGISMVEGDSIDFFCDTQITPRT